MNKSRKLLAITALNILIASAQSQTIDSQLGTSGSAIRDPQVKQKGSNPSDSTRIPPAGDSLIDRAERNEAEVQKLQTEVANKNIQLNQYNEVVNSFCTISSVSFNWWSLEIITYSTSPTAPCNVKEYINISTASVKEQLRATENTPLAVAKGGTHFRTMDVARTGLSEPYIYIGNIKMRPASKTRITIFDLIRHPSLITIRGGYGGEYQKMRTKEASYFRWDPGSIIFYLEGPAPEREIFAMTAFTSQMLPTLNRGNLSELGSTLALPKGWNFRSKITNQVIEYRSGGIAYDSIRMIDEYGNYYVKIGASQLKDPT
jgi:hypothetical protein